MAVLSALKIGSKVSIMDLEQLINSQSYQVHGNQIVGDCVQWHSGDFIQDVNHLAYAPDSTNIYAREHYFGMVTFTKNENEWFVTSIRTH